MSTEFCLDFEASAAYSTFFIDLYFLVGGFVAEDVDVLVCAVLAVVLGHFAARDHHFRVPDFAFNELF